MHRSEFLKDKVKTNRKGFPFVLDFNSLLPDVGSL